MSPRQRILAGLMDEDMLSSWDTDKGLEALVSFPTGEGNAAKHYARLEALYPEEKEEHRVTVPPDSRGVQEILAGAQIKNCSLTPTFYPHMETGTSNQPDILVYQAYLRALLAHAADLEKANKPREAAQMLQSGLIWGWHLTADRPNLVTLILGLGIKLKCARAYSRLLQRLLYMDRSRAAREYAEYVGNMMRRVSAKARIYLGDFENFNCLYSTIKVAKQDQEPLWRQEAVLRLGVLRHGAPDRDLKTIVKNEELQRLATQTLVHLAEHDPVPWIQKLAHWSVRNVTPERFQEMRRKSLLKSMTPQAGDASPAKNEEEGE